MRVFKKRSLILLLIPVFIMYLSSFVFAASVVPSLNNSPHDPVKPDYTVFKVEQQSDDTYTDGVLSVTLEFVTDEENEAISVSWSANISVEFVYVMGGSVGNLYSYTPGAVEDEGLTAPVNDRNGKVFGISHVTFYYKLATPPPPPPPTTGTLVVDKRVDGNPTDTPSYQITLEKIVDTDEVPMVLDAPQPIVHTILVGLNTFTEIPAGSYILTESLTGGATSVSYAGAIDSDGIIVITAGEITTVTITNTFETTPPPPPPPPPPGPPVVPPGPPVVPPGPPVTPPTEEITEVEVPLAILEVEEDEIILDDEVPLAVTALPKTGEVSPLMFYGLGTLFTALGLGIRKRRQF